MSTFSEQVAAALDVHSAEEAADRLHNVVMGEITTLDAAITPKATGYFNHSFIPDLMLAWTDLGVTSERPLYLRHSLEASEASGDWRDIATPASAPIYLSLARDEPLASTSRARERVADAPRALVTTVPALDELTEVVDTEANPVLNVVRANVVRSARGLVVESDVDDLVLPSDRRIEESDLTTFNAAVDRSFTNEGALRINRVFDIVQAAVIPDTADSVLSAWSGVLSDPEIRSLVPYLLSLEGVNQNRAFWRRLGSAMTMPQIERMFGTFADLDLTPLVSASVDLWEATRGQLTIRAEVIDNDAADRTPRWLMIGRTLGAQIGPWRLQFAWDGKKLRGRENSLPARWDDLKPSLVPFNVTEVQLWGVSRRVTAGSDGDTDVTRDADRIIASIDDSFQIPRVEVQVVEGQEPRWLQADFLTMLVHATPSASLASITRAALAILAYRYPVSDEEIATLLGE